MKFFKNNKAVTLIELITSVAISSILILIIFAFVTNSVERLVDNDIQVSSIEQGFEFKDIMQRFIRGGYSDAYVIGNITNAGYTGTTNPNPNNILYLKKLDLTQGIIVGIVNLETGLLQRDYIYGDNFLGYRYLTPTEMTQIDIDNNLIYGKEFTNDKIFQSLRMRDFKADVFNEGNVIDIYFSVINLFDKSLFDKDFADFFIDKFVIDEYSLVF